VSGVTSISRRQDKWSEAEARSRAQQVRFVPVTVR